MQHGTVGLEDLEEAAHVSAFEFLGQLDGQLHRGDGTLRGAWTYRDLDGKSEVLHSDTVDDDAAMVGLALGVEQGGCGVLRVLHEGETYADSRRGAKVNCPVGRAGCGG